MQTYTFHTLDVFTTQIFGGNPLAVFPDAQGLTSTQMQAIAQELNLSETVFVLPSMSEEAEFTLRIFTPAAELPFAGHPTVGTTYLLAQLGLIPTNHETIRLQEGVGIVPVRLEWSRGKVLTTALQAAQIPELNPITESNKIHEALGLQPSDLMSTRAPMIMSCGLPFLCIPLSTMDALERCRLDIAQWEQTFQNTQGANFYPVVIDPAQRTVAARMFAPSLGIIEDPATGAAATALAGYLHRHATSADSEQTWQITQGVQMGRPSQLTLTLTQEEGNIKRIMVGGHSVLVSQGQMRVPKLSVT